MHHHCTGQIRGVQPYPQWEGIGAGFNSSQAEAKTYEMDGIRYDTCLIGIKNILKNGSLCIEIHETVLVVRADLVVVFVYCQVNPDCNMSHSHEPAECPDKIANERLDKLPNKLST